MRKFKLIFGTNHNNINIQDSISSNFYKVAIYRVFSYVQIECLRNSIFKN